MIKNFFRFRRTPLKSRGMQEYYAALTDIVTIFWEFHKDRLNSKNMAFAYEVGKQYKLEPFNPETRLRGHQAHGNPIPPDVIENYSNAVRQSMDVSWNQFVSNLGLEADQTILQVPPVPEESRRFFHPYVIALATKADRLARKYSKAHVQDFQYNLEQAVGGGVTTGTITPVQLSAIFGDSFTPALAIKMSQVEQNHVGDALHEIGLRRASRREEPSHSLLHPEEGLDHARLAELGRGKTLGCPAGKIASPETRKFLLDTYGIKVRTSMLYEYAAMINSKFNTDVREWVNGLTPEQRSTSVTRENLRLISGDVWRSVAAGVTPGKCPFPGFRK